MKFKILSIQKYFNHFKMYNSVIQWHLFHLWCFKPPTVSSSKIFHYLQRKLHSPISSPFSSRQPYYFLSWWICLFWISDINSIIQYLAFCIWPFSLSIMFSSFIHVVVYISTAFSSSWLILCVDIWFFLSVIHRMALWIVSTFCCHE